MPGLKILVADANARFLNKARKALDGAGYEVVLAKSVEEARNVVAEQDFDAVVAASALDGYALCRAVKVDRDPTVPCVLMVPEESNEVKSAAAECGAENFLVQPVKDRELLLVMRDLATIRHLKRRLVESRSEKSDHESAVDPYTGFHDFAYFKEVLFAEVKRARRYKYPVSLLMCAYDAGAVPKGFGGEDVRKRLFGGLAVAVRKCMREYDIAVAYQDGQVLVLMPHTGAKGAHVVAKRIVDAIGRATLKVDGESYKPTISVGVAGTETGPVDSFSALVREARRALEGASRRGGNAVGRS